MYSSIGEVASVISCRTCIPVLLLSIRDSGVFFPALAVFAGRLLDSLYKRKAMKDREATTKVPSEIPTPVPIFADSSRPAAAAVADGSAAVGARIEVDVEAVAVVGVGIEVDVEAVVWKPEAEEEKALENVVEGVEEVVEFTVARILLSTLGEMRSCPTAPNSPRWLSQQVVFTSLFVRGQKLPSEQLLSC